MTKQDLDILNELEKTEKAQQYLVKIKYDCSEDEPEWAYDEDRFRQER